MRKLSILSLKCTFNFLVSFTLYKSLTQGLIAERGKLDRLAGTITDQMYNECQDLLQLFGIPWIVAPSEAEAQCAFLDINGTWQNQF